MDSNKIIQQSFLLTFVKILTMVLGMVQTMLLTRKLLAEDYALYAKTMTCLSVASNFSVLGLTDSILYFFNKTSDIEERKKYINTIFFIQMISGALIGFIFLSLMYPVSIWLNSPRLVFTIPIVFIQPLLTNLLNEYSALYASSDLAKDTAVRNGIMTPIRLVITVAVLYTEYPVYAYFAFTVLFDVTQVVYFHLVYKSKMGYSIKFNRFEKTYIPNILKFSVPLGLAIVVKAVLMECDKLIVSNQCTEYELATYAAVSRTLPVTMFSASMATLLLPHITRCFHNGEKDELYRNLRFYYLAGAVTSIVIGFSILPVSREAIIFLYSEKYVSGIIIFIIYLLNDIVGFSYAGMLLTITGNSKTLLRVNAVSLIANIALDYLSLRSIGILGPAIVTLTVTTFNFLFQSHIGCRKAGIFFSKAFPGKEVLFACLKCGCVSLLLYIVKIHFSLGNVLNLLVYGAIGFLLSVAYNKKVLQKIFSHRRGIGEYE